MKTKYFPYILIALALVAGLILNNYLGFSNFEEKPSTTTAISDRIDNRFKTLLIYPKKNQLKDFQLNDQSNDTFSNQNIQGSWNLLFIGYTNCPDVCPNTLTQLVQLYNTFEQKTRDKIQIIFLAVDPARDTPEHLRQYLEFFHEDFVGITGGKGQIDQLVKNLGGIYSINSEEGEFYTVDHSARIFIVDPKGRRFGIIASHSLVKEREQLMKDLTELIYES